MRKFNIQKSIKYEPNSFNPLNYYHIAGTFKNTSTTLEANLYVNGELAKDWADTPGIPIAVDNIPLSIGSDLPTGIYSTDDTSPFFVEWGGYFKGNIDDIRFYNEALTNAQIISLYNYENENTITE